MNCTVRCRKKEKKEKKETEGNNTTIICFSLDMISILYIYSHYSHPLLCQYIEEEEDRNIIYPISLTNVSLSTTYLSLAIVVVVVGNSLQIDDYCRSFNSFKIITKTSWHGVTKRVVKRRSVSAAA